jgi:tagatose 1,6-diphosphate aldolase GatY/KbaY
MTSLLDAAELRRARREGRAIPAFSAYNLEQCQAICRAAEAEDAQVILQAGSSAFAYAGRRSLQALAVACARDSTAQVGVHLDHSEQLGEIDNCLEAGYSSVMFDGSALPFDDNVRVTRTVVERAHACGAWVEAELAGIAGDEDDTIAAVQASALTDPGAAERFVAATGVDALAVAIGNVHGIPAEPVRLDLERLAQIADAVEIPLVLHGASGLDDEQVTAAIALGVAKINVNTELRRAFRAALLTTAAAPPDGDGLPALMTPMIEAVADVARTKIALYRGERSPAIGDRA